MDFLLCTCNRFIQSLYINGLRDNGGYTLKEYLVGAGGWVYFKIPGVNSLRAYSKVFNFVEVNSTFYQIPPIRQVERWRKYVPNDFQFSVRAHRSITYKKELQPTRKAFLVFERLKRICNVLDTDLLHLQIPASVKLNQSSIQNLADFLSSVDLGKLRLALEVRHAQNQKLPAKLVKTMQHHNMIHCIDLSRDEKPAYESDILYTRLFGRGRHNIYQPADDELAYIDKKARHSRSRRIVMSFHYVKMYKDAARLKTYKQIGRFPKVTDSTGLDSLEEILNEDTHFPTTKEYLIHVQGWKLFDLSES